MSTFSKDIGNTTAADDTGEPIYVKRKIAFGMDGEAFDVSSVNPLPVTGTLTIVAVAPGFTTISVGPELFTATQTSQLLIAANPNRSYIHVINNTQDIVYLQYNISAAIREGMVVLPNDQFQRSGYELYKGAINIISTGTSTQVELLEGTN